MKAHYEGLPSIKNQRSHRQNQALTLFVFFMTFSFTGMYAQTQQQKAKIVSQSNYSKLNQLTSQLKQRQIDQKEEAIQAAKKNGWEIIIENPDRGFSELQRLGPNGEPIYYSISNANAAKSTRVNHINAGGSLGLSLDGEGMTAHIWDGGAVYPIHPEFDGSGGDDRAIISDGVTQMNNNSFHAQHVTGTVIAAGLDAAAKGMASKAKAKTHEWTNDLSEAAAAAADGMIISNHSYGYNTYKIPDQYFGAYLEECKDWDEIMFNAPFYLMVSAAGNDGLEDIMNESPLEGNSGYDKIAGHGMSKNGLTVANGDDADVNSDGTLNSVVINPKSSQGPSDDLRIKPDITGNGTTVYSVGERNANDYFSLSGTSMAAPNVTGSLLLLQQHYSNTKGNLMKAATLKGLALHTADDAGTSGPDAVFGWGLLNVKTAAETISEAGSRSKIEELSLSDGQTYTITVESDNSSPLQASISWTDRPGVPNSDTNSSTAALVNDLDIRVTKGSTTYSPYRLTGVTTNDTGDNKVDPYERVDVANAAGKYTITVTHKGSLEGGSQNYSLIITGLESKSDVCTASVPKGVSSGNVGSDVATIKWNAVSGATYDLQYREKGGSSWMTSEVNGTSFKITSLKSGAIYETQVRSKCSDGSTSDYSDAIEFTTETINTSYCASNGNSTSDEYISRVQLGTIDNTSDAGNGGYSDFTSKSTNVSKGSQYTITITPKWSGQVYQEGYSVWIDYNQDGDFEDSGEQVWTKTPSSETSVQGSFAIPSEALIGSTRMRVSLRYNTIPVACDAFDFGEVEDYNVVIGESGASDTEAPSAPSRVLASDINSTSVTLSWTASTDNVAVTAYDVYQGNAVAATVSTTSTTITGLTAGTTYQFKVKAKDAAGNISGFSNVIDVKTTDTSGGDICEGVEEWDSSKLYQPGDKMIYNGRLHEMNSSRNWVDLGPCDNAKTSLYPTNSKDAVTILQNPVENGILQVTVNSLETLHYYILDIVGKNISNGKLNSNINIQSLETGSYFLKVVGSGFNTTKRFIKK